MIGAFLSEVFQRFAGFSEDVILPGDQLRPEIRPLVRIHELVVFREHIIAKIDLLTQRDSPEEHLNGRVYNLSRQPVQAF